MTLTIRKAMPADIDHVVALRIESETWLHAAGIRQWIDRERGIRNIEDGIHAGTTYVVTDDGAAVVATLTLNGPDPDFWEDRDDPADALYLYKLMISRNYRGTGLGDELLDWACRQAENRGKRKLRLDCWRENHALRAYYEHRGFRHVRTVVVEGRGSGALYERPAEMRLAGTQRINSICLAGQ